MGNKEHINNNILMDKVYSELENIQCVLQNRHKAMKFSLFANKTISQFTLVVMQIK